MSNLRSVIHTNLILGIVGAVAAAMFALLPASAAQAEPAQPNRARAYYGAIALSNDGTATYAFDYRTKRAALSAAYKRCKSRSSLPRNCRKVGWVRNACGAVAVKKYPSGYISRYHYGYGRNKAAAKAAARRNFGGQIAVWVCTTR